jgi:hypothetical protein
MECDAYLGDIDLDLDKFTTFGFIGIADFGIPDFGVDDFSVYDFSVDEIAEIATSIEPVLDEVPCSRPDCPGKVIFPDICKTCSKCRETGRKYKQKKKGRVKSGDTIAEVKNVTVPAMLETVPDNGGGRAKPKRVHANRAKIYKCQACGVGHRCPAELATHNKVCKAKSKKGKFRINYCEACDKNFPKPSYLINHENGPKCKARKRKKTLRGNLLSEYP